MRVEFSLIDLQKWWRDVLQDFLVCLSSRISPKPPTLKYFQPFFQDFFFPLQEYPLDDLCNEVIERWKTSRANVLQEKKLVKGKNRVTSQHVKFKC